MSCAQRIHALVQRFGDGVSGDDLAYVADTAELGECCLALEELLDLLGNINIAVSPEDWDAIAVEIRYFECGEDRMEATKAYLERNQGS